MANARTTADSMPEPAPSGDRTGAPADSAQASHDGPRLTPVPRQRSVGMVRGERARVGVGGRSKTDLAIEEAIAKLVVAAPPLSPETRARLAELFSVTLRRRR